MILSSPRWLVVLLFLSLPLPLPLSRAYLPPPSQLRGIDDLLADRQSEVALTPGYLFLKGGLLENMRDLVKHPLTPLLQTLFTRPDHQGLRLTRKRSEFASYLSPELIGSEIWPWLKTVRDPSEKDLEEMTERLLQLPGVQKKKGEYEKIDQKLVHRQNSLQQQESSLKRESLANSQALNELIAKTITDAHQAHNIQAIGPFTQRVKRLKSTLEKLNSPHKTEVLAQLKHLESLFQATEAKLSLVQEELLLVEKDRTLDHPNWEGVRRSTRETLRQLVLHQKDPSLPALLSALVWHSAENKADLLNYYAGLANSPSTQHLILRSMSPEEVKKHSLAEEFRGEATESRDPNFLPYSWVSRSEPGIPFNSFSNATVGSQTFPACGEVFALNLLRVLVERDRKVDFELLHRLGTAPEVVSFLEAHPNLPDLASQRSSKDQPVYDEFASLMSRQPGVTYARTVCEISGSHSSMLKLFQSFFSALKDTKDWDVFFEGFNQISEKKIRFDGSQIKTAKIGKATLELDGQKIGLDFQTGHFRIHFLPREDQWHKKDLQQILQNPASSLSRLSQVGLLSFYPRDSHKKDALKEAKISPLSPDLTGRFASDEEMEDWIEREQLSPEDPEAFAQVLVGAYERLRNDDSRSRLLEKVDLKFSEPLLDKLCKIRQKRCELMPILASPDFSAKRKRHLMEKVAFFDRSGACSGVIKKYLTGLPPLELARFVAGIEGKFYDP